MSDSGTLKTTLGGDLGKYLGLTAQHMNAFATLGLQLYRQGKTHEATTVFKGMIALDDHSYYGYAGLGAIALSQEPVNLKSASENLERAAELNSNDPTVYANLGELRLRQARFEESALAFRRSLSLDNGRNTPATNRVRVIIETIHLIREKIESENGKPNAG